MVKGWTRPLRLLEGALAASVLYAWTRPWLAFMGSPVLPVEIRERLSGPHKLVSAFTSDSQVSLDYALSAWLWVVPCAAGIALGCRLLGMKAAMPALAAGAAAVSAFLFLRIQLRSYPFQRLEDGAWITFAAGIGLLAIGLLRMAAESRARGTVRENAVRARHGVAAR
jgi:hypothetical protein